MFKLSILVTTLLLISCEEEKTYPVGAIKTDMGTILLWLHDGTPNHKASFIKLASENYWDSLTFNRVIKDFVAQGGCPDTPEGFSDCPYLLDAEFSDTLLHVYGAVGAGRDDNPQKQSAGCQFYIVQNKEGIARLNGDYTIFGQVLKGMDVVDKMVSVDKDSLNAPITPIQMEVNIVQMTAEDLQQIGFNISKK